MGGDGDGESHAVIRVHVAATRCIGEGLFRVAVEQKRRGSRVSVCTEVVLHDPVQLVSGEGWLVLDTTGVSTTLQASETIIAATDSCGSLALVGALQMWM